MSGSLDANETTLANGTLVVYWIPGENDNAYNLNNGKKSTDNQPLSINLGIKVEATQDDVEFDSFGSDYDAMSGIPGGAVNGNTPTVDGVTDFGDAYVFGGNDPMDKNKYVAETLVVIDEPVGTSGQVAVANVNAKVSDAAVVLEPGASSTVWFIDSDLTLPEGAYALRDNSGSTPQVILRNTTINGTLVTEANLKDFLKYFKDVPEYMFIVDNSSYNTLNTDNIFTSGNVDKYSETNAPLLSDKNAKALVYANKDYVAEEDNFAYITAMPDSNAVNVYNASIEAKNIFISNTHCNYFLANASFTIPEGGKLIINEAENQVFVFVEDITINGKLIEFFAELETYMEGNIAFGGFNFPD